MSKFLLVSSLSRSEFRVSFMVMQNENGFICFLSLCCMHSSSLSLSLTLTLSLSLSLSLPRLTSFNIFLMFLKKCKQVLLRPEIPGQRCSEDLQQRPRCEPGLPRHYFQASRHCRVGIAPLSLNRHHHHHHHLSLYILSYFPFFRRNI